ncbi:MAG: cysteine desulfurase/selenocysteine lyase, partial [Pseudohongiellaceae bacterium]
SDSLQNGSTGWKQWDEVREHTRAQAGRLLGCSAAEVALSTSTSQGLITVAEGLALRPGDEIVVIEDDFPANQIPWYRQERRGARIVVVPRRDGRVELDDILSRVTPSTRMVAVPFVLFDSGQRLDLVALGAALADHPTLFCVDAIQGLGAFPLDMTAAHIDFLSSDSHKWMLGMEGIGLFACRTEHLDKIDSPLTSWLSMAEPFAPYRPGRALRPDAGRFEYAALPTMEIFGLNACLKLLLDTGIETMAEAILKLTDRLCHGLKDQGWTVLSPRTRPEDRSGIILATPPEGDVEQVVAQLEAAGVSVVSRAGAVRFSPHAWNTADEVDRVLKLLRL